MNIHPAKTEIKFENEQFIWKILSAAVKESLGKFNVVPSIVFDTEGLPDIPVLGQYKPTGPPKVHYNKDFNPFKNREPGYSRPKVDWEGLYGKSEKAEDTILPEPQQDVNMLFKLKEDVIEKGALHLQFKGRFILTSVKSGLMIIDQHHAHIRVLFDRYMEQIQRKQGMSQRVLFPEILQLPPSEAVILQSITEDLVSVGFELSDLSGGSYAINAIPSGVEGLDPIQLVRNMIHAAAEKGSDVKEEVQTQLALTLARTSAIVYGQVLSNEEMVNLVDALFACRIPNYTPSGRIILTTIKEEDIEKLFK